LIDPIDKNIKRSVAYFSANPAIGIEIFKQKIQVLGSVKR